MAVGDIGELALRARSFALPGAQKFDCRLLDDIVGSYAEGLIAAFLARHEQEIAGDSAGLVAFLQHGVSGGAARRLQWQIELGFLRDSLLPKPRYCTPLQSAALVALALARLGQDGSWECCFRHPASLRAGEIFIPQARQFAVHAGSGGVQITVNGASGDLQYLPEWYGAAANSLVAIATADADDRVLCLLSRSALPQNVLVDQQFVLDEIASEHCGRFSAAIDVLGTHVPIYRDWVKRPLRDVILLDGSDGRLRSGSFSRLPGTIYLSAVDHPARLAEMLVHEASHQYFHVLSLVGDVDDGSDKAEHFSPVVKEGRSIRMILFAYHAFANVLRFYRLYRDAIGPTASLEHDCAEIERDVRELEAILADNRSLTPLGWSIFAELRSALQ
jgi:HEXXH motif-containing protein